MKALTKALEDEAIEETREMREEVVQDAIDTFTLAVDATYTNVKVTDPDDWPFTY